MEGINIKELERHLVNNHNKKFNRHILEILCPSERLCVDEIFSRWYGLGGDWINLVLPHYVQTDCKSDTRYKVQDNFCGINMVMMKLTLVKDNTAG